MQQMMGDMDIAFPNLGIYLHNVPKTIMVGSFGIAIYGILIALLLSIMIGNILIKNIAKRSRPFFHKNYKLLIKQPWDYSFPSGHTLASFAAATVFFYMNPDVGAIALIYAALIALSRLYLRVHFFTDVFFSMILGTGLGMLAMFLYDSHFFGILAR